MTEIIMASDQDKKVKQLKRELEGWREVILPINSVLLWEKNWFPGMLVGITTTLFLLLWYVDPPVLTTISVIGLTVTLIDYLVPALTASFCHPENWTGSKERQLEEICRSLAVTQNQMNHMWAAFYEMRHSRPRMYYATVVSGLLFLAWLGNVVNNMFLTYLIITAVILLPGMKHHGLLEKYCSKAILTTSEVISGLKQKKN